MREPSHDDIGACGLGRGDFPGADMVPGPPPDPAVPDGPASPPSLKLPEREPADLLRELIDAVSGADRSRFARGSLTSDAYSAMTDAENGREASAELGKVMDALEGLDYENPGAGDLGDEVRRAIEAERAKAVDPPPLRPDQLNDVQLWDLQSDVDEEIKRRYDERRRR